MEPRTAVCTVVSKSELPFARALMASVRQSHPDWQPLVLLADEIRGAFDPRQEPFAVVEIGALPIPDKKQFFFRYSRLGLRRASVPWFLDWLFRVRGVDRAIALDAEYALYRPMSEVTAALDRGVPLVVTPHRTSGREAGDPHGSEGPRSPGGLYLGLVALARQPRAEQFLNAWQCRLEYQGTVHAPEAVYLNRTWLEMVPALADDLLVVRNEGYAGSYWHLTERRLEKGANGYRVNGQPLTMFHFQGLAPRAGATASDLASFGAGAELLANYWQALRGHGLETCRSWPYTFSHLADGTAIPNFLRHASRPIGPARLRAGEDPFQSEHAFFNETWGRPGLPVVTNLMRALWESRPEIRSAFPDIDGAHRESYCYHFLGHLADFAAIPPRFRAPVVESVERMRRGPEDEQREDERKRAAQPPRPALAVRVSRRAKALLKSCLRPVVRKLLGPPPAPAPAPSVPPEPPVPPPTPPRGDPHGLNLVGYIRAESGLGEAARLCARSAAAVNLPFSVHDFENANSSRQTDDTWAHKLAGRNEYWLNLFYVNGDMLPPVYYVLKQDFFAGHYNVAHWAWELPELPDEWLPSLDLLDEVWVPSRFTQAAVSRKASVPVLLMPYAVHAVPDPRVTRAALGLPENKFLFLTMYDAFSFQARKNPQAVIDSFHRAFPEPRDIALVVKINNGKWCAKDVGRLKETLSGIPGVHVLDAVLSRQEVYSLEDLCDCCVSLHRSEGFGLPLAESMFLGKPAIGTHWSGNVDFMTAENSCPVRYELVPVAEDAGPYRRGQVWAEPDRDHAAWYMRQVVEEAGWRRAIAARGQHTVRTEFSPEAVGRLYQDRLQILRQMYGFHREARRQAA